MKTSLTLYRLFLVLFAVGILITSALMIIPLVRGDLSIYVHQEDIDWRIEEDQLLAGTNITMNNSANFDIEDIELALQLELLDDLFIDVSEELEDLRVGETRKEYIRFSKDIDEIPDKTANHLINNDTDINVSYRFKGQYSYALMTFDVVQRDTLFWGRLLNEVEYDLENAQMTEGHQLEVPIFISTNDNDLISGNVHLRVSIFDEDETKMYTEDSLSIRLGRDFSTVMVFSLSEEDSKELMTESKVLLSRMKISMDESEFSTVYYESIEWGAPMNNFDITDVNYQDGVFSADISFINDNLEEFDFIKRGIVYDDEGNVIGRKEEGHIVGPGESFEETIEMEIEGIPKEAHIEIEDEDTGYIYEEVIEF